MPKAQFSQSDGNVRIELRGPDGELKESRQVDNLVVTAGKNWLASYLAAVTTSNMIMMAVGTASTAVTAGDTVLGGEFVSERVVGTLYASQNLWQNTGVFGANVPSSTLTTPVNEAGIFNAPTAGSMYTHATFPTVNKAPADTLTIIWQVTNS
jgi:hypothetical protein